MSLLAKPGAKFPRFGACCLLQNELVFMPLDAAMQGNDCFWCWQGQRVPQRCDATLEGGARVGVGNRMGLLPLEDLKQNRSKTRAKLSERDLFYGV